jgi:hypothetical protein
MELRRYGYNWQRLRWPVLATFTPADQAVIGRYLDQQTIAFRKGRLRRIELILP